MTDHTHHSGQTATHPEDHQHAIEACEHALDALDNGNLSRALALLDEAIAAGERAQHDGTEQAYRETAYDCYE